MPASKQVRSRQNRQKERIVVSRAERKRAKRNRRIASALILVILLGIVGVILVAVNGGGSSNPKAAATSKQCVGLKDKLPKGAPPFALPAGPPPTTLGIKDLTVGTGPVVPKGGKVTVNYVGVMCSSGTIFDSSYKAGKATPVQFPLTGVIKGFGDGIPGMKVGGARLLSIPAAQAYGANPPAGAGIPPDEPLFFYVAVTKIG